MSRVVGLLAAKAVAKDDVLVSSSLMGRHLGRVGDRVVFYLG